jgi:hypothetical protein
LRMKFRMWAKEHRILTVLAGAGAMGNRWSLHRRVHAVLP